VRKGLNPNVTSRFSIIDDQRGRDLTPCHYRTGEFARKARVSVRTLRFYDRQGLLTPSEHSVSGHRRYSDGDLITLQKILAMKLLGFTLTEIKGYLATSPGDLSSVLAQQKAMLQDRRIQLDRAIRRIAEVEAEARTGEWAWESLLKVIEVMQMNEDRTWVQKHLTQEQIDAMTDISSRSYSEEAAGRLAARPWTEADQERVSKAWADVYAEAERLAAAGADPAGPEGQALARRQRELIQEFTQGDKEIEAGLSRFYSEARELPAEQSPYMASPQAREFAEKAVAALEG